MKSFKEFIDEMMVTGSTGDAAGFSEKSRKGYFRSFPTAALGAKSDGAATHPLRSHRQTLGLRYLFLLHRRQ